MRHRLVYWACACLLTTSIAQAQYGDLPTVDGAPSDPTAFVLTAQSQASASDVAQPSPQSPTVTLTQAQIEEIVDARIAERKLADDAAKAAVAPTATSGSDLSMSAKWNNGLELSTKDKNFRVHVGGRYQFDTSWFSADQNVQQNINIPYADGVDFRRARFRIDGTLYKNIDWAAEMDFVNSFRARNQSNSTFTENTTVALTDFWWQYRELPFFGTVRVGQQKEAIGFEHLVSSRYLPFMERSYNQDTFYGGVFNGFTPGIAAFRNYGSDKDGVIHYGLYKPTNNVFGYNTGNGDYSVVMRMTRLLAYSDEGSKLLHVGVSGKQASAVGQAGVDGRIQTFRTREAIRSGLSQDWPVPAGINLYGDDMQQVNGELAAVYGRMTFQSEYLVSSLQDARNNFGDPTGNNAVYHGGYVQLLCYLTDDYDHYNKETGVFERVSPTNNFSIRKDPCGSVLGGGAWQLGARYNYIDLNDIGLNGGVLHNQTYGLNWFLNPNMKAQWNYIATYRDVSDTVTFSQGSGWIHGFGGRIAFDF